MWDVVCVTCQNPDLASEIEKDLYLYQKNGIIVENAKLVVVTDPKPNIGSGGATFNAILTIAEQLSISHDYSVINIQMLRKCRILILLMGRDFQFDMAGRGVFNLPCTFRSRSLVTCVPNYLHTYLVMTNHVATGSRPGIWLASTDIVVSLSSKFYEKIDWSARFDMLGVAVPASIECVADRHAAYCINEDDTLANILYRVSEEELRKHAINNQTLKYSSSKNDEVLALLGIVYLSSTVAESIFSFYEIYPLNSCTYMGVDSGAEPITLSILMDVMRAPSSDLTVDAFIDSENPLVRLARKLIYEKLSKCVYRIVVDDGGEFLFPDVDRPELLFDTLARFCKLPLKIAREASFESKTSVSVVKTHHCHSFFESRVDPKTTIIINSHIGSGVVLGRSSIVVHSLIDRPTVVEDGSIVIGLEATSDTVLEGEVNRIEQIHVPRLIALHQYPIRVPSAQLNCDPLVDVIVVFGLKDIIHAPATGENLDKITFCNITLEKYLQDKEIDATDLWPQNMPTNERTLYSAKLYPVLSKTNNLSLALWLTSPLPDPTMLAKWRSSWRLSMKELQSLVDYNAAFSHRNFCFTKVCCGLIRTEIAARADAYLLPMYHTSVVYDFADKVLAILDDLATNKSTTEIKLSRVLANIAALLACISSSRGGGIQSGPSHNPEWNEAYELLLAGNYAQALPVMARIRTEWLDAPQSIMRASKYYEGACRVFIRRAGKTAEAFICLKPSSNLVQTTQNSAWVVAEAPCRADLVGGWSDILPISYEVGGAVLNIALLINGQRSVGAKIRRVHTSPGVTLCWLASRDGAVQQRWTFESSGQLRNLGQAFGQTTLVKAVLQVTGVIKAGSHNLPELLTYQLQGSFGSPGIEIHTWTDLDSTGLGTRSISAGALIAAIWTLSGREYDIESICHAVIQCEQLMATCAGWQDSIGGLVGGVKLAYSQPGLPLHLQWQRIGFNSSILTQMLNKRLVFIDSGNRPLFGASTTVNNVVRNWYSNEPNVIKAARKLSVIANDAAKLLQNVATEVVSSIDAIGEMLTASHELKKILAPGSESESFQQIVKLLADISLGATMNGCGDGGFMTVLLNEEYCLNKDRNEIMSSIDAMIDASGLKNHFGEIIGVKNASIAEESINVYQEVTENTD